MKYSCSKIHGNVDHALLSEIGDLALTHGNNDSAEVPEDLSLSRWYERERALASLFPAEADFALTHGSGQDNDPPPMQEIFRHAA